MWAYLSILKSKYNNDNAREDNNDNNIVALENVR